VVLCIQKATQLGLTAEGLRDENVSEKGKGTSANVQLAPLSSFLLLASRETEVVMQLDCTAWLACSSRATIINKNKHWEAKKRKTLPQGNRTN